MSENTNTSEVELVLGTVESIHSDIPTDFLYTLGKSLIEDHKEMIIENENDIIDVEESIVDEPVVEELSVVVEQPAVEEPSVVVEKEPVVEELTPTVEINVKCGCFSVGTSFLYKRYG